MNKAKRFSEVAMSRPVLELKLSGIKISVTDKGDVTIFDGYLMSGTIKAEECVELGNWLIDHYAEGVREVYDT